MLNSKNLPSAVLELDPLVRSLPLVLWIHCHDMPEVALRSRQEEVVGRIPWDDSRYCEHMSCAMLRIAQDGMGRR